MARNRYRLPDVTEPVKALLLPVFVPDDPGYLDAVKGALGSLAYASNWQGDDANTRRKAADYWLQHYLESTELWTELEYTLSPLTINVNNNCCCDDGVTGSALTITINNVIHFGESDYTDIVGLPGGAVDDGLNPPTSDWVEYTPYTQYKCNYALQFAKDLIATTTAIANYSAGLQEMVYDQIELLITKNALSSMIKGTIAALFTQGTWLEQLQSNLLTIADDAPEKFVTLVDVAEMLDQDTIKCIVYSATSADDARTTLLAMWDQIFVDLGVGGNPIDDFTKYEFTAWFKLFIHILNLEPAFDLAQVAETFAGGDCSDCAGVEPPSWTTLGDHMVSYYRFDEVTGTRVDSHGALNLTDAALGYSAAGITQGCISCNGAAGPGASAAYYETWAVPAASWSVAFWFKPNTRTLATRDWLFHFGRWKALGTTEVCGVVLTAENKLGAEWRNTTSTLYTVDAELVTFDAWQLCALTYDADQGAAQLWQRNSSGVFIPHLILSSGALRQDSGEPRMQFGSRYDGGGASYEGFAGYIDEAVTFDRLLSATDLDYIYNVGQGLAYENYFA